MVPGPRDSFTLRSETTAAPDGVLKGSTARFMTREVPSTSSDRSADVAQLVERLICNQQVVGSTPTIGSQGSRTARVEPMERCPSGQREQTVNLPAYAFGGSNPPLSTCATRRTGAAIGNTLRGSSSVGRARAFQARGRGFDSRLPLASSRAHVAQSVEHFLGKEEVTGSNPVMGSRPEDARMIGRLGGRRSGRFARRERRRCRRELVEGNSTHES